MRQQRRPGAPARDRMRRGRRLADGFARAAGELLPHMLDHLPLPRNEFQRLGHVLAKFAQRPAAARAGRQPRINDALAWQVVRQWAARRLAAGKATNLDRSPRHSSRDLALGRGFFQIGKLQLELIDQPDRAFRRRAEPLMAQPGDSELQLLDLQRPGQR
jgi:hypothetical protein